MTSVGDIVASAVLVVEMEKKRSEEGERIGREEGTICFRVIAGILMPVF